MPNVKELFDQGYKQVSRKYRQLAGLPAGKTGIQALEAHHGHYESFMKDMEERAAEYYRTYCAAKDGNVVQLTPEEFNEWLVLNGRTPSPAWLVAGYKSEWEYAMKKDLDEDEVATALGQHDE